MGRKSRIRKELARLTHAIEQSSRQRMADAYPASEGRMEADSSERVMIFRSELDYISSCILDRPDIETGGQLFGYWTSDGIPVVLYAIGPGRNANHQVTFFNQDVGYLVEAGNGIRKVCGLHHIGEWHSHHKLGLARPSSHDAYTMMSTIREKSLGRFLLCIGNCDSRGERSTLNPFMCTSDACDSWGWDIIGAESPVRSLIDRSLGGILIHPHSSPCHSGQAEGARLTEVSFPDGYWLRGEWGRQEMNEYISHFRKNYSKCLDSIQPKIDQRGLAHLVMHGHSHGDTVVEDIMFPERYPDVPPVVCIAINGRAVQVSRPRWDTGRQVFSAFMKYISESSPVNR